MITPIHIAFDLGILYLIYATNMVDIQAADLFWILSASLIDLDHLSSKPIYHPRRNPFQTHFIHKNWKIVLIIASGLLFIRPVMFLGIGLISHLFLDRIYVILYKIKK